MENRFEIFTRQIAKISRNIRKIKTEEMGEFQLKSPHVSCLYYLYKKQSLTAKELCEACDEDKASISRTIEYLENNGYITCHSKTEKRYKSPLFLTEKGNLIGESIVKKIDDVLTKSSYGLSEKEIKKFYKSLILISDNLQKYCEKYGEEEWLNY